MLLIGRLRHRIVLTCMLHVQNYIFSSYNQSDHCFPVLSLTLPPSLLKPSTVCSGTDVDINILFLVHPRGRKLGNKSHLTF